jgi:hypothetical protein
MSSTKGAARDTPDAQRANRVWFVLTVVLVLLVIVLLPSTVMSLADEARNQSGSDVDDFFTGQAFDFRASMA